MNQNSEPSQVLVCSHCGAKLAAGQTKCWLCGAEQASGEGCLEEVPVWVIETSASRAAKTEKEVSRTHIVVLLVSVVVMGGLYRITPLLGLIGSAAFLPVVVRTVVGFAQNKPVSRQALLKDFTGALKVVAILFGVLSLVAACAIIAFLAVCAHILKNTHY